jgi:hypothetical protein
MDLGFGPDDTTSLSDAAADALFVEAGESYTDAASIHAATRWIYIDRLLMQAAAEVDYTQNETQEKASQRWDHLNTLWLRWRKRLDDALLVVAPSAARFGRTTRRPARIKEHPNGYGWGYWGW